MKTMENILLNENIKSDISKKLKVIWDIAEHYWYPLASCKRDDLIAFDSRYINNSEKIKYIKGILIDNGVEKLFEYIEDGVAYEIDSIASYEFWNSDDYFWNNEGFWFDDSMKWIIYISHEETITFGGDMFISKMKKEWNDWNKNLKWDNKN